MEKPRQRTLPPETARELIKMNLKLLQGDSTFSRACGAIALAEFDYVETSAALATAWEVEKDPITKAQMLESLRRHRNAAAKALCTTIDGLNDKTGK